jgi:predicted nucleotidyltransferase
MDMYKLKWTVLQLEIFRLLCIKAGQILNLREIARVLGVSPTAVSNSLELLEKEQLIKITRSKKIRLLSIQLNRDNNLVIELKRAENLKMIYESGLNNFLFNQFPGTTIVLFGSYSKGEDVWIGENTENRSDIDIAIIGSKHIDVDLTNYENKLERTININFYISWKEIHKHLKENILNGIILEGGTEL